MKLSGLSRDGRRDGDGGGGGRVGSSGVVRPSRVFGTSGVITVGSSGVFGGARSFSGQCGGLSFSRGWGACSWFNAVDTVWSLGAFGAFDSVYSFSPFHTLGSVDSFYPFDSFGSFGSVRSFSLFSLETLPRVFGGFMCFGLVLDGEFEEGVARCRSVAGCRRW